jgi:iron(II)-dependent oxidoreductase
VLRDHFSADLLAEWLRDSRQRTLHLVEDVEDESLTAAVEGSSLLGELGLLAWRVEKQVLRRRGQESLCPESDRLFGTAGEPAWSLSRDETLKYLRAIEDRVLIQLAGSPLGLEDTWFVLRAIFHEDLCGETLAAMRQALGCPDPPRETAPLAGHERGGWSGDVAIPGGRFLLGALPGEPFVVDNEKWAHPIDVAAFRIARAPVTQREFSAFVEDRGYQRKDLWSEDGWRWREQREAHAPRYWRREGDGWLRRDFDRWVLLEPDRPMVHVTWDEAEAYCRWARRRLPSEAEWEVAAAASLTGDGRGYAAAKRHFPWGEENPSSARANLDGFFAGCVDVAACSDGDSALGCRQLIGNVWEWTSSALLPYPGFVADPEPDSSAGAFTTHKVLRGGCWLTRSRLVRNTWRCFARPERRDLWAGFRTCAVEGP